MLVSKPSLTDIIAAADGDPVTRIGWCYTLQVEVKRPQPPTREEEARRGGRGGRGRGQRLPPKRATIKSSMVVGHDACVGRRVRALRQEADHGLYLFVRVRGQCLQCALTFSVSSQDALVVGVLTAPPTAFIQKVAWVVVELMLKLTGLVEPWLQRARQEALSRALPKVRSWEGDRQGPPTPLRNLPFLMC